MNGVIRWAFIGAGLCALVASFLIMTQKHASADTWKDAPQSMRVDAPTRLPAVAQIIRRDPFSGAPQPSSAASSQTPNGIAPPQQGPGVPSFAQGAGVPGIVPNPGGMPGIAPPSGSEELYVVGTIVGGAGRPLALVRMGNEADVVGVGDAIGDRRIERIVPQGIEFSDGSRLAVDSDRGSQARPAQPVLPMPGRNTLPPSPMPFAPPPPRGVIISPPAPAPAQQPAGEGGLVIDPLQKQYQFGAQPTLGPNQTPPPQRRLYTPLPE